MSFTGTCWVERTDSHTSRFIEMAAIGPYKVAEVEERLEDAG